MSKKTAGAGGGGGHTAKHTSAAKHTRGKAKHSPSKQKASHHKTTTAKVHTVASHPKVAKKRGLALADEVACCPSEALAASLRLTGRPVSGRDVLALHERTEGADDAGAAIWAALEAATSWGLGGVRPVTWALASWGAGPLILGVDLPGPHTVCAAAGEWWSWGEPWCPYCWFPDAVVEEAWVVTWPS